MRYFFLFFAILFNLQPVYAAESPVEIDQIKKVLLSNDTSALTKIVNTGIDLNMCDEEGNTLLLFTLNNNDNLDMARKLIEAGADTNAPSSTTGATPLILATSMADTLQQQAQKVRGQAQIDNTDLKKFMLKQMTKALDMLTMLIELGADVNQETPFGTPLMDASKNEWNAPIIQKLLENGAKINLTDRFGRTALFYASAFDSNKNVTLLLSSGCDINIKDIDGKSYMEAQPKDFATE